MEICKVDLTTQISKDSYIALGNFDGVHLGHKCLIDVLVQNAKKNNILSSVLIFREHTKNVIKGRKQELLSSTSFKYEILESLGVDRVYEMEFNKNIMELSPEAFVLDFLFKHLKIKGIVVGYDYRFGHKAMGNIELLKELCERESVALHIIEAVYEKGEVVSSTRIRRLIREGNLNEANFLLGRPFTIDGCVIKGKGLGRTLGFPTANLGLDNSYVIPKYGVYAGWVIVDSIPYKAAINIGINPTFNEEEKLEAFLLNYNGNLYGKNVRISLIEYIRPEIKFDDISALVNQMKEDIERIDDIL